MVLATFYCFEVCSSYVALASVDFVQMLHSDLSWFTSLGVAFKWRVEDGFQHVIKINNLLQLKYFIYCS